MNRPWLHRYAVFVAVCTLLLVFTGSAVSSNPERALYSFGRGHAMEGMAVGVLTIVLAIWITLVEKQTSLRKLAWLTVAVALVEGWLGFVSGPQSTAVNVSHTFLALVLLSCTAAITLVTSGVWRRGVEPVQDQGWPSLRSLASVTLVAVLAQAALGTSYRHQALGLMPHIAGAMVVALLIMVMGIFVCQQCPAHRSLRPCAVMLMSVAFAQVFLGITVLTAAAMAPDNALPVVVSILAHLATGGLTLAATMVLVILIRRNIVPKQ
jgi:heme A synthase